MHAIAQFHHFFDCCIGGWHTERTYHDLLSQEVERSQTDFTIRTLAPELKAKVLQDNHYAPELPINGLLGFHLEFETVSEKGEEASQALNMLFLPQREDTPVLEGAYLRDRGYEEDRPIVAHFHFDPKNLCLTMTTTYTKVVAIDKITLINPRLRLREIVNYKRGMADEVMTEVMLVGFGVEQKTI